MAFLTNSFVFPCSRKLLLQYSTRVNVNAEIYCQHMLIKYLFKYVNKGFDRCRIDVEKNNNDEIQAYINCRFICQYEVVWRLL